MTAASAIASPPRHWRRARGKHRGSSRSRAGTIAEWWTESPRVWRVSLAAAAVYLRRVLHEHAAELRGRGIDEELIEREVDTLSAAIKAASFTAVLAPDDQEPA
jgi:hypothetical protein